MTDRHSVVRAKPIIGSPSHRSLCRAREPDRRGWPCSLRTHVIGTWRLLSGTHAPRPMPSVCAGFPGGDLPLRHEVNASGRSYHWILAGDSSTFDAPSGQRRFGRKPWWSVSARRADPRAIAATLPATLLCRARIGGWASGRQIGFQL